MPTFDASSSPSSSTPPVGEAGLRLQPQPQYPHDNPDHPWHWTRAAGPDPKLSQKKDCNGVPYGSLYKNFHENGFATFTSCSLKKNEESVLKPVKEYTQLITVGRDVSPRVLSVRRLSLDQDTMEFIEFLHGGRRAFPFQTLNFPRGTQQPIHSDLIHFDTKPRTLMTAVWTALEDMNENNGPLEYFPKSHHIGTLDFDEIGLRLEQAPMGVEDKTVAYFSDFYGEKLVQFLRRAGLKSEIAKDIKYGQSFVWAAGLAHGGSKQNNMELSRLSQVTHYFFEGSDYYWEPKFSDLSKGEMSYRPDIPSCKVSKFMPTGHGHSCADGHISRWLKEVSHHGEL